MHERLDDLELAVDRLLARLPGPLHVAAPLGLGKPHRLLNALYWRVAGDPTRTLRLYTALSLDPPDGAGSLERRFLGPFVARHFGEAFPRLAYVQAQRRDELPANIVVEEFYLQSGALLGSAQAQAHHANLNYTHAARTLVDRGVNCLVQKVAASPDGARLSLSSNTDLTFDVVDALVAAGHPRPLLIAEVDPNLPWLDGPAVVDAAWFDLVVAPPGPHAPLFGLPRQPVTDVAHAIGLYASALVRDGGTLQIGIGALSDALCHALALRHTDNAAYRAALHALDPDLAGHPAVVAYGGLDPFTHGLHGCSEMITDGFMRLAEVGVLRRRVRDASSPPDSPGEFLTGAFYLGSSAFYAWLRGLDDATRRGIGMRRVGEVNAWTPGGPERRHARFFNTCMIATALGAAVSDQLADGRVVSGVGGQYNFVAMAHELPGARSALLLRATRDDAGAPRSNIRWDYGSTTIPRHLRDLFICEYGIADLRGKTDGDCVAAMLAVCDARFAPAVADAARRARKLGPAPRTVRPNTPDRLRAALRPFREDGTLPDYPLGSDFTAVEQRLVRALAWLKSNTATRGRTLRTIARALASRGAVDDEALARMDLAAPRSLSDRLFARLVTHALRSA